MVRMSPPGGRQRGRRALNRISRGLTADEWTLLGERSTQFPEPMTIVFSALGTLAVYRNGYRERMCFPMLE